MNSNHTRTIWTLLLSVGVLISTGASAIAQQYSFGTWTSQPQPAFVQPQASGSSSKFLRPRATPSQARAVATPSFSEIPIHKHAAITARMAANHGPDRIWRSKISRPKSQGRVDVMDTRNFSLFDYRKMFLEGRTPQAHELVGQWRGVNKGIVEIAGYRQFIKDIPPQACEFFGDNIVVHQVSNDMLRAIGWQPKPGPPAQGNVERIGSFAIERPQGIGPFNHGVTFSYRNGKNKPTDPANVLVDKVVVLDANHMLGRVTANFGPMRIPLAYFTLERIQTPLSAIPPAPPAIPR